MVAQIAEIHSLTADLEEEQSVEDLEQFSRRLVNRAQDRLAGLVCQFTKESDDCPSTLRIKARGRLIQEQQEFGLMVVMSERTSGRE